MSEKVVELEKEKEVFKPIKLTYMDSEVYELDFSRESAVFAQMRGFDPSKIEQQPSIIIPDLFYYAMRKNHKNLARNQVDAIRKKLFPTGLPANVLERLSQLYEQASLIDLIASDEDAAKNTNTVVEM